MMHMRTIEIGVGLFMFAGALALAFLAIQVSGINFETNKETYTLYARFDDVAGLKVRSKISIAGVTVGRVKAISVEPRDGVAVVEMAIESDVDQLPLDTGASILTEGILGGKYIGLSPGAEDDYLVDGDEIEITQGALVLENLIGDFIRKMGDS